MSAQPPGPGQDMAGPPPRPQAGPQQPPRPQAPPGAPVAGPPRPFLPGGAVAPPVRGPPPPRPSGPNSFAPQQRPPQPQGVPGQGPPLRQGPPPGHPLLQKQNSFQQRPPAPPLSAGSRQSSVASLGSAPDSPGPQIRRPAMEPEGTPPAVVKNRSFSIAGPMPGVPHHDEERRRSVSVVGGRPEDLPARSPGLAFIKEGVQSADPKESPLNVGLTRLSKDDLARASRESVRSDSSDGKGGSVAERPESRLSGSRMTESIVGSLDADDGKSASPKLRGKIDDDDDVVTHNGRAPAQNGTPNGSPSPVSAPLVDRSPSLTRSDSSPERRPAPPSKVDSPARPASAVSNASKTPEPVPKTPEPAAKTPEPASKPPPSPSPSGRDSARPPSVLSNKSERRVDTPEPKGDSAPDAVDGRPASRTGSKPTDFGTPIKSGPPDDRKATPRKAASAPRTRREGDNDSGVDESTQGNEHVNGSPGSPGKKSPSKIPGLKGQSATPAGKASVMRSPSKSATPHTPNTPDSTTSNTSIDKKKVPMNKVQVGAAPSPNIKAVKSKIGSLENATHKPGGGRVKIENRKLDFNKATPKIAAKNDAYVPGGGDKKITQKKLVWNAKSKVGSLENATHKPGGGDKKIETVKLDFKDKAKPKVASTVNIAHKPGGGDIKCSNTTEGKNDIENQKLDIKAQSKVGSLDNVKHRPGGGDVKIFDDKEYLKQVTGSAPDSVISPPSEECADYLSLQDLGRRRQSMAPQSIMMLNSNGSAKTRTQRPRTAREPSGHRLRNLSPRKCQTPRIEYERPPFRIY